MRQPPLGRGAMADKVLQQKQEKLKVRARHRTHERISWHARLWDARSACQTPSPRPPLLSSHGAAHSAALSCAFR